MVAGYDQEVRSVKGRITTVAGAVKVEQAAARVQHDASLRDPRSVYSHKVRYPGVDPEGVKLIVRIAHGRVLLEPGGVTDWKIGTDEE